MSIHRHTRPLVALGVIWASLACALLFTETVLGVAGFRYTPLRIQVVDNYSEWRYHHAFEDKHFEYDHYLIWRPRPGGEFNSQGYRGPEIAPKRDPTHFRIFAIGDSNTLGWLGHGNPNWPQFLGELDQHLTVVNAGVYGYTSFQGLRRFEQALAFHPDMALISFGCNDAMRVAVSDDDFASKPVRQLAWDRFLMKTRVGQLVLSAVDGLPTRKKEVLVPRVSVEDYEKNLRKIIALAAENGIGVVLLTRPFTGSSQNPWSCKNFAPEYNAATLKIGSATNTKTINVYEHFRQKTGRFADETHFTEEGHREMAKFLYEEIRPLVNARSR